MLRCFGHTAHVYLCLCSIIFAVCVADSEINKSVTGTSASTVNHPVGDDDGFTGSCTEAQMLVKPVM